MFEDEDDLLVGGGAVDELWDDEEGGFDPKFIYEDGDDEDIKQ